MKYVEEKRVVIYVVGGNAKVASKPDVVVDIVDFDNLEEYVEPAFTLVRKQEMDNHGPISRTKEEAIDGLNSSKTQFNSNRPDYHIKQNMLDENDLIKPIYFHKHDALMDVHQVLQTT
ncbi:hypothetical protein [Bacillus sp. NPDC094106]|uniref:hypothetical protein n=1 Tax=Bacillus sp. NPDC094106 TaxID=3363949 RepID=UPI0037F1A598